MIGQNVVCSPANCTVEMGNLHLGAVLRGYLSPSPDETYEPSYEPPLSFLCWQP